MISIDNTLISEDILDKKFVCDLNACKGACCVAGDSGAPLEKEELPVLDAILDKVKPYMVKKGVKAVEKHGAYVIDSDGDYTTTLVSDKAECAFVYFDETKTAKCAIEKAYYEGKIDWKKPISCHLYPIRISNLKGYEAVNYNKWDVCKPACECGKKLDVPVYKFLKEPLIRKYGKDWFTKLEKIAQLYLKK
jgi:hypothetical protein